MDRDQMKMAMLQQEQMFRQQIHDLHRLYHVQKQLIQQTQVTTTANRAPAIIHTEARPQFEIMHREKDANPQQFIYFSSSKAPTPAPAPAPAPTSAPAAAEDFNLELTLATGSSSSSSSSGNTGMPQGKRLKSSSNSDSGTTAVSSTSTDSELARSKEVDVTATKVRYQGEGRRMDEMGQAQWMQQCLSLKMA